MTENLIFLKLGGSLITDKSAQEVAQVKTINRIANEIKQAMLINPNLKLLIGHGGGSFGHSIAAAYGTHKGVTTEEQWYGFAQVSNSMDRLNALVVRELHEAGVPSFSFPPLSNTICENGLITTMATEPIGIALETGAIPVVYGDAVFDNATGGTIISTESILSYLAKELKPSWILLAGEASGVIGSNNTVISKINHTNIEEVRPVIGKSNEVDVTGGMESKVLDMLSLIQHIPDLSIRIFSGLPDGSIQQAIENPYQDNGTLIAN